MVIERKLSSLEFSASLKDLLIDCVTHVVVAYIICYVLVQHMGLNLENIEQSTSWRPAQVKSMKNAVLK